MFLYAFHLNFKSQKPSIFKQGGVDFLNPLYTIGQYGKNTMDINSFKIQWMFMNIEQKV